jgi:tripartite-type tricarboxylate transporter receptor subunit TctC
LVPFRAGGASGGLPDFDASSWQAVMAPAKLSKPILHRPHAEVTAALRESMVGQRLKDTEYSVVANTREAYDAFQHAAIERWRGVVNSARISLD